MRKYTLLVLASTLLSSLISSTAVAVDLYVEPAVSSLYTSNVFVNELQEDDIAINPALDMGVNFEDYWSLGYSGRLDAYLKHADLLSHRHLAYLSANPAWGEDDENEFFIQLSAETQQNDSAYTSLNYVKPAFDTYIVLEPALWFRWSLSQHLSYRTFYDDLTSSSFDSWTRGSVTFTTQTQTTITPRVGFGYRYYPKQDLTITDDSNDLQTEAGLHLSQGLWERAGLSANYAFVYAIGESGLVLSKSISTEFSYIGEDFLFTGHQAHIGFKQVFDMGLSFGLGTRIEQREYPGWSVVEADGTLSDKTRQDTHLSPGIWIEYAWWPDQEASVSVPELKTGVSYNYLKQWSNDEWYDTDQHTVFINVGLAWLL